MSLQYSFISKFYDLLDVFYFNRKKYSPRQAMLDYIKDEKIKVLDVCTGTASNAILIASEKQNANVVGIDLSKEMLELANRKIIKSNTKNIKTYVMDATKTNFDNETFDVVIISLVLHEIKKELAKKMLSEAKRVLKSDGEILIVEWEQPKKMFQKLVFSPIKQLEPKGFKDFLKINVNDYFAEQGLKVKTIRHCDYSKVIKLGLFK